MNRKGIEFHFLLMLIVAVFVFIVLGAFFAPKAFGDITNAFDNLVPNFKNVSAEYEGVEILRYDLTKAELQYYDGTKGHPIHGTIVINEKKIEGSQKEKFEAFFESFRGDVIIDLDPSDIYEERPPYPLVAVPQFVVTGVEDAEKGFSYTVAYIKRFDTQNDDVYGILILTIKNELIFEDCNTDLCESLEEEYVFLDRPRQNSFLISEIAEWRDSVLENPIKLTYYDVEDEEMDNPINKSYKVDKTDVFLVVELDKPLN